MGKPFETLWGNQQIVADRFLQADTGSPVIAETIVTVANALIEAHGHASLDEWKTQPFDKIATRMTEDFNDILGTRSRIRLRIATDEIEDLLVAHSLDDRAAELRAGGHNIVDRAVGLTALSTLTYMHDVIQGGHGLELRDYRCVDVGDEIARAELEDLVPLARLVDILVDNR